MENQLKKIPYLQAINEQEGNDVVFMIQSPVEIEGTQRIIWSRNNQHVLSTDRYRPYNTRNRSSLAIRQLTFDDAGNYSAESEDSYGTSLLASINLNVQKRKPEIPVFLRRLHDISVKIGSRARFLVEIESLPPLKITWYRDNQILRKNDRLNFIEERKYYCLEIDWTMLHDEGHWTCIAENQHGCSVSSAYLTILVPNAYKAPRFVEELKATLAEDGTVSLECKVTGIPTPTLLWYKDGKKIKAGDTFALRMNSADSPSLGTYSCVAKNCLGQAFSSSSVHFHNESLIPNDTSIFLLGPQPKFLRELKNAEAQIESKLTLSCQVVVPPWPKAIDWYNKNGKIEENEKYKTLADGLGMYAIEIKKVEMVDDGDWKCMATSFFGVKAFTSCYVTVKFPKNYKAPKFLENLRAVMTPEGLVSFECKVVGYPTPQLEWLKDGRELKPGDVYQLTGTRSLGTYCCIARNSMGIVRSTTVLTHEDIQSQLSEEEKLLIFATNQPPYFIQGLTTQEMKINEEFRFHVQVSAKPDPKIFWYRNDELIEKSERISIFKEDYGNFCLHLKNLELKDQAEWKCVAVNDYGQSVTSCFIKLIIPQNFKSPRFLEELKANITHEGTVNLECKVIGVPQPELRWYKDGKQLKPGEIYKIISGSSGTCCLGTYSCKAINCMATVYSSASVLAYEDPDGKQCNTNSNRLDILSIITEEHTSQLNNSDMSTTYEEAAGISFSFDGKEVSISLYETPDLTQEEALQIVEMYANELTEHILDQNYVQLPSLRFVKDTITTGNILMEATIIDVPTNDFFNEDELKTDADVENSMMDDSAFVTNNSLHSEDDKPNSDYTLNILQSSQSYNDQEIFDGKQEQKTFERNHETMNEQKRQSVSPVHGNNSNREDNQEMQTEGIRNDRTTEHDTKTLTTVKNVPPCEKFTDEGSSTKEDVSQMRISFDSEDDSLYEFEKLKAHMRKKKMASLEANKEKKQKYSLSAVVPSDRTDLSVLETLALSISTIEMDLDKIQNDIICSKEQEQSLLNVTLTMLQSLLQPVREIRNSLEIIENRLMDESNHVSNESILEVLSKPISQFHESLVAVEKTKMYKNDDLFHKTSQSILNAVVEPLNEINEGLYLIKSDLLKNSVESTKTGTEEQRDTSVNSNESNDSNMSVDSDSNKMIVILNEYTKELKQLDVLIQQKYITLQDDNHLLSLYDNLSNTVEQMIEIRDWSLNLHENILNNFKLGSNYSEELTEFNCAVVHFLDANINVVKTAMHTSTGFNHLEQFFRDTTPIRTNLKTTMKVTANLSPLTAMNYINDALNTYTNISEHFPKNECLLQNVLIVNPDCIKCIDDSIQIILNSLDIIEKCSQVENSYHKKKVLLLFGKLKMPIQQFIVNLLSVERQLATYATSYTDGYQVYAFIKDFSGPLQGLRKEINILVNDCQCLEHQNESVFHIAEPVMLALKNLQNSITAFHEIVFSKEAEDIDMNFMLSTLNNLNPPLCELANKMMAVEDIILQESPIVSDPKLGIRIVMQTVSSLVEAIADLHADNHNISSVLSQLSYPLKEVRDSLKDIHDQFYEKDLEKINITMLKTLSSPFNSLQKELIEASSVLIGDLKNAVTNLQCTILTIQDQVSFEYGDEPASIEYNIMTLQTLLHPIHVLKDHCDTIKKEEKTNAQPLMKIIAKLEKEQIGTIDQIETLLRGMLKDPEVHQYKPQIITAIYSSCRMMKDYKNIFNALKSSNVIQTGMVNQSIKTIIKNLQSDLIDIRSINSEFLMKLKEEQQIIIAIASKIENEENNGDLVSFCNTLESLEVLGPVFYRIMCMLKNSCKMDVHEGNNVKCYIALLQSLNTVRTLQNNVKHFQSSSNTDSIHIPMLLSFLNSCERLEIRISDLLSLMENFTDRNIMLAPEFYRQAICGFTVLNGQLIHLNKCLIDQSMSDDDQKEIPFESSINAFTALLSTVSTEIQNKPEKQIHLIIKEGILSELVRLKNDILFNMSLIQTEDEVSFNDSDQLEEAISVPNPDLMTVCVKSISEEIKKCDKYFDRINKIQSQQKLKYIYHINSSLESMFNIINFVNQNSLEGEESQEHTILITCREPVLQMLQQVHKLKVLMETLNNDILLGSNIYENTDTALPLLIELNKSFEKFKLTLLLETNTATHTTENSPISSDSDKDKTFQINMETDSTYNDISSSISTNEFETVKHNDHCALAMSQTESSSFDEKSIFFESSSYSDTFSESKTQKSNELNRQENVGSIKRKTSEIQNISSTELSININDHYQEDDMLLERVPDMLGIDIKNADSQEVIKSCHEISTSEMINYNTTMTTEDRNRSVSDNVIRVAIDFENLETNITDDDETFTLGENAKIVRAKLNEEFSTHDNAAVFSSKPSDIEAIMQSAEKIIQEQFTDATEELKMQDISNEEPEKKIGETEVDNSPSNLEYSTENIPEEIELENVNFGELERGEQIILNSLNEPEKAEQIQDVEDLKNIISLNTDNKIKNIQPNTDLNQNKVQYESEFKIAENPRLTMDFQECPMNPSSKEHTSNKYELTNNSLSQLEKIISSSNNIYENNHQESKIIQLPIKENLIHEGHYEQSSTEINQKHKETSKTVLLIEELKKDINSKLHTINTLIDDMNVEINIDKTNPKLHYNNLDHRNLQNVNETSSVDKIIDDAIIASETVTAFEDSTTWKEHTETNHVDVTNSLIFAEVGQMGAEEASITTLDAEIVECGPSKPKTVITLQNGIIEQVPVEVNNAIIVSKLNSVDVNKAEIKKFEFILPTEKIKEDAAVQLENTDFMEQNSHSTNVDEKFSSLNINNMVLQNRNNDDNNISNAETTAVQEHEKIEQMQKQLNYCDTDKVPIKHTEEAVFFIDEPCFIVKTSEIFEANGEISSTTKVNENFTFTTLQEFNKVNTPKNISVLTKEVEKLLVTSPDTEVESKNEIFSVPNLIHYETIQSQNVLLNGTNDKVQDVSSSSKQHSEISIITIPEIFNTVDPIQNHEILNRNESEPRKYSNALIETSTTELRAQSEKIEKEIFRRTEDILNIVPNSEENTAVFSENSAEQKIPSSAITIHIIESSLSSKTGECLQKMEDLSKNESVYAKNRTDEKCLTEVTSKFQSHEAEDEKTLFETENPNLVSSTQFTSTNNFELPSKPIHIEQQCNALKSNELTLEKVPDQALYLKTYTTSCETTNAETLSDIQALQFNRLASEVSEHISLNSFSKKAETEKLSSVFNFPEESKNIVEDTHSLMNVLKLQANLVNIPENVLQREETTTVTISNTTKFEEIILFAQKDLLDSKTGSVPSQSKTDTMLEKLEHEIFPEEITDIKELNEYFSEITEKKATETEGTGFLNAVRTNSVEDDVTAQYWDSKTNQCTAECFKNHEQRLVKGNTFESISEQESFETALDDMETSCCEEILEWDDNYFEIDNANESLPSHKAYTHMHEAVSNDAEIIERNVKINTESNEIHISQVVKEECLVTSFIADTGAQFFEIQNETPIFLLLEADNDENCLLDANVMKTEQNAIYEPNLNSGKLKPLFSISENVAQKSNQNTYVIKNANNINIELSEKIDDNSPLVDTDESHILATVSKTITEKVDELVEKESFVTENFSDVITKNDEKQQDVQNLLSPIYLNTILVDSCPKTTDYLFISPTAEIQVNDDPVLKKEPIELTTQLHSTFFNDRNILPETFASHHNKTEHVLLSLTEVQDEILPVGVLLLQTTKNVPVTDISINQLCDLGNESCTTEKAQYAMENSDYVSESIKQNEHCIINFQESKSELTNIIKENASNVIKLVFSECSSSIANERGIIAEIRDSEDSDVERKPEKISDLCTVLKSESITEYKNEKQAAGEGAKTSVQTAELETTPENGTCLISLEKNKPVETNTENETYVKKLDVKKSDMSVVNEETLQVMHNNDTVYGTRKSIDLFTTLITESTNDLENENQNSVESANTIVQEPGSKIIQENDRVTSLSESKSEVIIAQAANETNLKKYFLNKSEVSSTGLLTNVQNDDNTLKTEFSKNVPSALTSNSTIESQDEKQPSIADTEIFAQKYKVVLDATQKYALADTNAEMKHVIGTAFETAASTKNKKEISAIDSTNFPVSVSNVKEDTHETELETLEKIQSKPKFELENDALIQTVQNDFITTENMRTPVQNTYQAVSCTINANNLHKIICERTESISDTSDYAVLYDDYASMKFITTNDLENIQLEETRDHTNEKEQRNGNHLSSLQEVAQCKENNFNISEKCIITELSLCDTINNEKNKSEASKMVVDSTTNSLQQEDLNPFQKCIKEYSEDENKETRVTKVKKQDKELLLDKEQADQQEIIQEIATECTIKGEIEKFHIEKLYANVKPIQVEEEEHATQNEERLDTKQEPKLKQLHSGTEFKVVQENQAVILTSSQENFIFPEELQVPVLKTDQITAISKVNEIETLRVSEEKEVVLNMGKESFLNNFTEVDHLENFMTKIEETKMNMENIDWIQDFKTTVHYYQTETETKEQFLLVEDESVTKLKELPYIETENEKLTIETLDHTDLVQDYEEEADLSDISNQKKSDLSIRKTKSEEHENTKKEDLQCKNQNEISPVKITFALGKLESCKKEKETVQSTALTVSQEEAERIENKNNDIHLKNLKSDISVHEDGQKEPQLQKSTRIFEKSVLHEKFIEKKLLEPMMKETSTLPTKLKDQSLPKSQETEMSATEERELATNANSVPVVLDMTSELRSTEIISLDTPIILQEEKSEQLERKTTLYSDKAEILQDVIKESTISSQKNAAPQTLIDKTILPDVHNKAYKNEIYTNIKTTSENRTKQNFQEKICEKKNELLENPIQTIISETETNVCKTLTNILTNNEHATTKDKSECNNKVFESKIDEKSIPTEEIKLPGSYKIAVASDTELSVNKSSEHIPLNVNTNLCTTKDELNIADTKKTEELGTISKSKKQSNAEDTIEDPQKSCTDTSETEKCESFKHDNKSKHNETQRHTEAETSSASRAFSIEEEKRTAEPLEGYCNIHSVDLTTSDNNLFEVSSMDHETSKLFKNKSKCDEPNVSIKENDVSKPEVKINIEEERKLLENKFEASADVKTTIPKKESFLRKVKSSKEKNKATETKVHTITVAEPKQSLKTEKLESNKPHKQSQSKETEVYTDVKTTTLTRKSTPKEIKLLVKNQKSVEIKVPSPDQQQKQLLNESTAQLQSEEKKKAFEKSPTKLILENKSSIMTKSLPTGECKQTLVISTTTNNKLDVSKRNEVQELNTRKTQSKSSNHIVPNNKQSLNITPNKDRITIKKQEIKSTKYQNKDEKFTEANELKSIVKSRIKFPESKEKSLQTRGTNVVFLYPTKSTPSSITNYQYYSSNNADITGIKYVKNNYFESKIYTTSETKNNVENQGQVNSCKQYKMFNKNYEPSKTISNLDEKMWPTKQIHRHFPLLRYDDFMIPGRQAKQMAPSHAFHSLTNPTNISYSQFSDLFNKRHHQFSVVGDEIPYYERPALKIMNNISKDDSFYWLHRYDTNRYHDLWNDDYFFLQPYMYQSRIRNVCYPPSRMIDSYGLQHTPHYRKSWADKEKTLFDEDKYYCTHRFKSNTTDYLLSSQYDDWFLKSHRHSLTRGHISNYPLIPHIYGYDFDCDTMNYVHHIKNKYTNNIPHSQTDHTVYSKWTPDEDLKMKTPFNRSVWREAKDILHKYLWNEKYPNHFNFDDYISVHRPQFYQEISYSESRTLPKLRKFRNEFPTLRYLHAEDTVSAGVTVTLHVEVEGNPKPNIEWLREEKILLPTPSRYKYIDDVNLHTLVITNISYNDAGKYQCKAWNKYGMTHACTNINVISATGIRGGKPPMFITRPETIMCVNSGSDVSVSFRLSGDPKPKILWMKGLTDITENQRSLKETINDYTRLTLKRVQLSDAGTYFIIAKNKCGSDRAFFTLRVNQRSRSPTPVPIYKHVVKDFGEDRNSSIYLKKVPGPISLEPYVTEFGKNYLTLTWSKPTDCGGAPILAYRIEYWLVGEDGGAKWKEVGMTPSTSLDIFNLRSNEKYNFRVTARNQYGWGEPTVTNKPIIIEEVSEFPEFERCLPGELKVLAGSKTSLECQIKYEKGAEVQWFKDGILIEENYKYELSSKNGKFILKINDLNDSDSGRYVCEAFNKHGKIFTFVRLMVVHDQKIVNASLRLNRLRQENDGTIDAAPQFMMRLRNRRVQMCYPVRLTCQVIGHPTLTVVWLKDGKVIEEDQYFSIYKEAGNFYSLEINQTKSEHSGTYSAVATNSSGTVLCKCNLIVDKGIRTYIGPKFVDKLEKVYSIAEGSELRIRAVICAYPSVGITWRKNGVRLRPSRRLLTTINHEGDIELTIAHIRQQDSGIYTCIATNEVGNAETNTRVDVYSGNVNCEPTEYNAVLSTELCTKEPRFLVKPCSFKVAEGDHVVIECKIVGDPKPQVTWLRDRLKLNYYRDSDEFKISNEVSGPFEHKLEIPRVKFDHTGAYTVIATNDNGETKAVVSLQVYSADTNGSNSMKEDKTKYSETQKIPKIKRHLSDIKCSDGDSIKFECEIDTDENFSDVDVYWYKNGKLIPLGNDFQSDINGNVVSLVIKQVYSEDEGQYSCVVSNDLGSATSTACLIVNVPEEKENHIHRQLKKPPNLQSRSTELFADHRISSSRENTSSERPTDRISHSAPKFYAIPQSKVVEEGETVRFQCAVTGHPPPTTIWDRYNVPITPNSRISILEQDDLRILEISNVTVDDEGLYRVKIGNECGQSEATARLDVINHRRRQKTGCDTQVYEKHFGRHMVGKVANVGGKCAISCNIPNASSDSSATWYKNGETLKKSQNITSKYIDSAFQLQFNKLTLEDSGVYTCILENNYGKTRCSAELIVFDDHNYNNMNLQPPVFTTGIPQKSYCSEGKIFEFRVKLQGALPIHVTWFKNDKLVPDCQYFQYVHYNNSEFGLRFRDIFADDGGLYKCEAYNCHGDAQSTGYLVVRDTLDKDESTMNSTIPSTVNIVGVHEYDNDHYVPEKLENIQESKGQSNIHSFLENGRVDPACVRRVKTNELIQNFHEKNLKCNETSTAATILEGPADKIVLREDTVTLTVKYFGNPEPVVKWMKAGHELTPDNRISFCTQNGESVLRIEKITADDGGKYEVFVENVFGIDSYTTFLAVEGSPDAPNGQPKSTAGDRSATITWCSPPYDGGSKITGYAIEMRSYSNPRWRRVIENCHSLFCTVRGLTPGESYIFRIRAENVHGLSNPSMDSAPTYITHADVSSPIESKQVNIQNGEIFAKQYEILEELGRGRYGVVHKTRDKEFNDLYAAKIIRCIKAKDKEKVREEINIMNLLKHPKLLLLIAAFENSKEIIMVTEYISGGELFERVVADDFTLTERDCILFMRQICEGVAYIHKHNVVHLDLKPENIMCVSRISHQIKLIDFGLAQKISPETPVRVLFGTPEFIPPEIINYEPIGTESDMWSVGVICYVLLSGLSPFMGENDAETFANITRADFDFDDEAFSAISKDAKDFISSLLIKRKEKRLTAKQCLHHKWLAQHDKTMSCIKLCTDKLKKFIIRRKWQKTGNAIRFLGRMATLSAASRRNSSANSSSSSGSPRVSLCGAYSSRMSSLGEDDNVLLNNERTDFGDSDKKNSIAAENYDTNEEYRHRNKSKDFKKSVGFKEAYVSNETLGNVTSVANSPPLSKLNLNQSSTANTLNISSCIVEKINKLDLDPVCTPKTFYNADVKNTNDLNDLAKDTCEKICETNGKSYSVTALNEYSIESNRDSFTTNTTNNINNNCNYNNNDDDDDNNNNNNDNNNNFNISLSSTCVLTKTNSELKKSEEENLNEFPILKQMNLNETKLNKPTSKTNVCKFSNTATIRTAERLKKFEQLSSMTSCTPKIKKETFVSNKSNFQKAVAFWNRE